MSSARNFWQRNHFKLTKPKFDETIFNFVSLFDWQKVMKHPITFNTNLNTFWENRDSVFACQMFVVLLSRYVNGITTFLTTKTLTFRNNFVQLLTRTLLPPVVTVLVSVLVFVAVAVDDDAIVFVTNTVTFVPPMLNVGDELPPKL